MREDEIPSYDMQTVLFEDIGGLFVRNGLFHIRLLQVQTLENRIITSPVGAFACPVGSVPTFINTVIKATWNSVTYGPQMEMIEAERVGRH